MAANPQEYFSTAVPAALAKSPDKAREINAVYLFEVTGEGGGEWTVDLVANPPTCTPGRAANPNCTITIASSDFMALLGNPSTGMQLYFTGKLKVSGDPMLATKLQKLFAL